MFSRSRLAFALRDQEVAGVAVSDFNDVARAGRRSAFWQDEICMMRVPFRRLLTCRSQYSQQRQEAGAHCSGEAGAA